MHFNAALSLLTIGDYRARLCRNTSGAGSAPAWARGRICGRPLWLGETPLAGKTILLHAEQGLGDTVMFARYAPLLARAGARVVLEVQPELKGLLAGLEGVAAIVARGEPLPPFDVHCPLTSLPLACKTELSNVPADIPYLHASEARSRNGGRAWTALPSPRVALAWSGRATHVNDRNRSLSLSQLEPLLSMPTTCALSASSASCVRPTPKCWRASRASPISAASLPTSPTPRRCWRSPIS